MTYIMHRLQLRRLFDIKQVRVTVLGTVTRPLSKPIAKYPKRASVDNSVSIGVLLSLILVV